MIEVSLSIRTEKLTSKNFVKNYNHSNRKQENINDNFLGKNIKKDLIKDNIFLVDNDIFDNCKNTDELWEIVEKDYKERTDNIEEIRYKIKRENVNGKSVYKKNDDGSYVFLLDENGEKIIDYNKSKKARKLKRKTNQKINVNGETTTQQVETSLMHEHIIYLGSQDDLIFDNNEDYKKYYDYMLKEFNEIVDGQTVKAVIHFDEATPHLHIFQSQYNFKTGKFETKFNKDKNNYKNLQATLKEKSNKYLMKYGIKHKAKKKDTKEHLSVKEYKKQQLKIQISEKEIDKIIKKEVKNIIRNSKEKALFGDKIIEEMLIKNIEEKLKKYLKLNYVNYKFEEFKLDRANLQKLKNRYNEEIEKTQKEREDLIAERYDFNSDMKKKEKNIFEEVEKITKELTEKENILKAKEEQLEKDFEKDFGEVFNDRIQKEKLKIESEIESKFENKLKEKDNKIKKLEEEKETIKKEITEKIESEMRAKINYNFENMKKYKSEAEALKETLTEKENEIDLLKKDKEDLTKKVNNLEEKLKELEKESSNVLNLKSKISELESELRLNKIDKNITENLDKRVKEQEKEIKELEETIDKQDETRERLLKMKETALSDKNEALTKNSFLEIENSELKEEIKTEKEKHEKTIDNYEAKIEKYEEFLRDNNLENEFHNVKNSRTIRR